MLDRLIRKLGYIKPDDVRDIESLTEEELSFLLAKKMGLDDSDFPESEETKLFQALNKVEGLRDYLKFTAHNDKNRYFGATTKEEQGVIRGAFARTVYLRARVIAPDKKKVSETKIKGLRYDK